jgi:hypothetical protein
MSSLSFLGNDTSYLKIPNSTDLKFRTSDFTIEWYQYQTDSNEFPRIFQIGTLTSTGTSIGVSIESGNFYFWSNNTPNLATTLSSSAYKNKWVHFAICRSSGTTRIFMNGTSIYSMSDNTDYNSSYDLVISNETTPANNTAFGGYIYDFNWVKGAALYTSDFTVSDNYPDITSNTILRLTAYSFDGTLGNSVVNNNVGTYSIAPTNHSNTNQTQKSTKPLYSNNALVFYKKGSLSATGVSSVRNSRYKSRRI